MARYQKYRNAWRNKRSYASKAWGNRRSYAKKAGGGLMGMSAPFLTGVAFGMTDYDKQIPYEVKIAIACLPSSVIRSLPGGGIIQNIVRGILIGDIIQSKTGYTLGSSSGTIVNTSGSY